VPVIMPANQFSRRGGGNWPALQGAPTLRRHGSAAEH
jgi:hypothetical protein